MVSRVRARCVGAILALLIALPLFAANELTIDHRRARTSDLLTVMLSLEGTFAGDEEPALPLVNLEIVGEPSVSSEFAWYNGRVSRRKTYRYRVRPLAEGRARVGPLVLVASGEKATLPAIDIDVEADRAAGSNDAEQVLRELLAAERDPLFVIGEIDKTSVYVGEPVTVTWWLYNAAVVQQWQVITVPKLAEFWSEEQGRNETPERVYVGDMMVQRLPVRRVVLFPLQSGHLEVGGIGVEAAVMRRARRGPFAMYAGELSEVTFTSAPLPLDVKPLPPGAPVDAVGELTLACDPTMQKNGGPVVTRVTLSGLGNLRSANAPRYEGAIAGSLEIEGGEVNVVRDDGAFAMSRQWRYLVFPKQTGLLELPPLTMQVFDPRAGVRRELRCGTSLVNAVMSQPAAEAPLPAVHAVDKPMHWGWIAGLLSLLVIVAMAIPRVLRELRLRREVQEIVRDAVPSEIRERVEQRVQIDLRELSERGDAMRALRSLLDAAERDRDIAGDAGKEIARRVRDVLEVARERRHPAG